ncbi:MAG: hypothetical protein Q7R35_02030 [Elusimicrobiota bacterium]|nr:hypothetical protein [Elusimicrobiota bacterium]
MTRETILATLTSCWEFRRKHPAISITLSVLVAAACAGGIYLLIKSPFLRLSCFTGGCAQ